MKNNWNYCKDGEPLASGHYEILTKDNRIEKDDYTTVQKVWWNSNPIAWRKINN